VQCTHPRLLWANSGHRNDYERSGSNAATRGKTTLISVNSPGRVSTSIEPACCLTMMSWLMESPSPVPSPVGLVVKKGLNIFSFTSGRIPVPLRANSGHQGFYSITSSARASTDCGTVRPRVLAVLRLTAKVNFVGACTGRFAGFSPFKMRST